MWATQLLHLYTMLLASAVSVGPSDWFYQTLSSGPHDNIYLFNHHCHWRPFEMYIYFIYSKYLIVNSIGLTRYLDLASFIEICGLHLLIICDLFFEDIWDRFNLYWIYFAFAGHSKQLATPCCYGYRKTKCHYILDIRWFVAFIISFDWNLSIVHVLESNHPHKNKKNNPPPQKKKKNPKKTQTKPKTK